MKKKKLKSETYKGIEMTFIESQRRGFGKTVTVSYIFDKKKYSHPWANKGAALEDAKTQINFLFENKKQFEINKRKPNTKLIKIYSRYYFRQNERPTIEKDYMTEKEYNQEVKWLERKGYEVDDNSYEDGIISYYYD